MENFATIQWLRDIERRESGTPAGKGIFAKRFIPSGTVVGLYWGHLVDDKGVVRIVCETTAALLQGCPEAIRPIKKSHMASVMGVASNLCVDGDMLVILLLLLLMTHLQVVITLARRSIFVKTEWASHGEANLTALIKQEYRRTAHVSGIPVRYLRSTGPQRRKLAAATTIKASSQPQETYNRARS
jgi:hypothetical protein